MHPADAYEHVRMNNKVECKNRVPQPAARARSLVSKADLVAEWNRTYPKSVSSLCMLYFISSMLSFISSLKLSMLPFVSSLKLSSLSSSSLKRLFVLVSVSAFWTCVMSVVPVQPRAAAPQQCWARLSKTLWAVAALKAAQGWSSKKVAVPCCFNGLKRRQTTLEPRNTLHFNSLFARKDMSSALSYLKYGGVWTSPPAVACSIE